MQRRLKSANKRVQPTLGNLERLTRDVGHQGWKHETVTATWLCTFDAAAVCGFARGHIGGADHKG
jgi:hypothetical protein